MRTIARCGGISQHHAQDPATSKCATCSGTSQVTHSRWTERTCEHSRRGGQTLRRVLLGSRVQLRTCQSGFQHVCRSDSCCSHSCTAAPNADSPQHRAAGWRFIGWNEVQQRELLAEAKRLRETGELFPRGTVEESHAPYSESEATDSEPEAHVLESVADDHSRDDEDAPTGVEKSAAPAVAATPERAAMSQLERLQAIRFLYGSKLPTRQQSAAVSGTLRKLWWAIRAKERRVSAQQKELSFVVASLSIRSVRSFHVTSRSSLSFALRIRSNDQCDCNQCCLSFEESLRKPQKWSLRLTLPQHWKLTRF